MNILLNSYDKLNVWGFLESDYLWFPEHTRGFHIFMLLHMWFPQPEIPFLAFSLEWASACLSRCSSSILFFLGSSLWALIALSMAPPLYLVNVFYFRINQNLLHDFSAPCLCHWTLSSLDSKTCLIDLPLCTLATQCQQAREITGLTSFVSHLWGSLSYFAWCPMSWKPLFYTFCVFFFVFSFDYFRQETKSCPCSSSWSEVKVGPAHLITDVIEVNA